AEQPARGGAGHYPGQQGAHRAAQGQQTAPTQQHAAEQGLESHLGCFLQVGRVRLAPPGDCKEAWVTSDRSVGVRPPCQLYMDGVGATPPDSSSSSRSTKTFSNCTVPLSVWRWPKASQSSLTARP